MEISETKFESMSRDCQKLDTICDYVMGLAEIDDSYASTDILAYMAGIGKEAKDARKEAREAKNEQ